MFKRLLVAATVAVVMIMTVPTAASAAPAQSLSAPTTCVQSLQIVGFGAGYAPGEVRVGIEFTAACPGRIQVAWQAVAPNGHIIWKDADHHFVVSTTTANSALSAIWVYGDGKTPAGTYNIYGTLAAQNGKTVYFHERIYTVVVS